MAGSRNPGRGRLRVYLGAAPGVGKTYAMLDEAHRRAARGTDVVVGLVETHGRVHTANLLGGLEIVQPRAVAYRDRTFPELDLDALLARRPQVALVDELAHTNIPGSRHEKRWQDVEELLDAGIDVLSTVNVQHLESLNDVVEAITGVAQRETVPDEVVRRADQVELVDMAPEALRRRMAHGNVYDPGKIDAALGNYFRIGNLTALRELALLWMAGKVDEQLDTYRAEHGISRRWETRERVVVALTGGSEGETLIRRGARIATRAGGELLAVHVTRSDGLISASAQTLQQQRELVESLGGSYHQVIGHSIAAALLAFARGENASQLVLGASRRSWLGTVLGGRGVAAEVIRSSGKIDVHMIPHDRAGRTYHGLPELTGGLTPRRRIIGAALAAVGLPALTVALTRLRGDVDLAGDLLLYLTMIVNVAVVGGLYPALFAAVGASLLADWFFTDPPHTLYMRNTENILALGVFVVVATAVSVIVDIAARRTRDAARARAEADTLSTLSGSLVAGQDAVSAVLDRVRETFGMTSATLLERQDTGLSRAGDTWVVVGVSGPDPCPTPQAADTEIPIRADLHLALRGRVVAGSDRSVLTAFAAQAAVALDRHRLAAQAADAADLAETDRTRTALLGAVSHDLRSPLASAKAAVSSLRASDVFWTRQEQTDLLATADESLDRLTRLVENLLDMSRLQAGALAVSRQRVGLDEIVPRALDELGPSGHSIEVDLPETLPEVNADPPLLERVIANLVANAVRHSPAGQPPLITASALGDRVELRVIDRGHGIPEADHERVFAPFQRLGDRDNTTGVGLGLALSRGLTEAMDGQLTPEETPGGGLTMVLSLPAAPPYTALSDSSDSSDSEV
ncbi:sensor histidine kinase KdpD [Frankia sp. Cr1]|uniref:sensor histidine kinase KdpD n=2 Tax=Frankia TaxID=1854 RepID=UPI002AD3AF59|nr:sensor histidine kinase KdpD [Frankia sp. Cr1]